LRVHLENIARSSGASEQKMSRATNETVKAWETVAEMLADRLVG
jgi:hypothetical protein